MGFELSFSDKSENVLMSFDSIETNNPPWITNKKGWSKIQPFKFSIVLRIILLTTIPVYCFRNELIYHKSLSLYT